MDKDGLSMRSLSLKSGLQEDAVKIIFSGKSLNPSIETMLKLSKALRCSVDELCGSLPTEKIGPLQNRKIWIETIEQVDGLVNKDTPSRVRANIYMACYELMLQGIKITTAEQINTLINMIK